MEHADRKMKNGGMSESTKERGFSRRGFLGAMGVAAMAAAIPVVGTGCAPQPRGSGVAEADEGAENFSDPLGVDREALLQKLRDCPEATEDLTLPDGRVIDKAYVTLYNRENRLGDGLNGTPGVGSFDLLMRLWSVEEAEQWNEMPLFERFTAYDYAVQSGRTEAEALEILNNQADRRLINRTTHAGIDWFWLYGYAGAIRPSLYSEFNKELNTDCDNLRGVDDGTASQYPIYHACPVSADVVEGGEIVPYRDWRAVVERHTVFSVQPCGCRNDAGLKGTVPKYEEGIRHCLVFGEMAEFMIETGNNVQITKEECIAEIEKLIDAGYVPEFALAENPDILCLCRSDRCAMLEFYRLSKGEMDAFPNASAYMLSYDSDKCIQCGACKDRCPMQCIEIGDDGRPHVEPWCIACGQCALVCPGDARILKAKPDEMIPPVPVDLFDQTVFSSVDRMARGLITDFAGTELPDQAIEASEAAMANRQFNWIVDTRPRGSAERYDDGVYEASRIGLQGSLAVTVAVEGGVIARVEIGENDETPGFGSRAIEQLPGAIVAANGLDVDTVSGATHTSVAILEAVEDCLAQAGMPV